MHREPSATAKREENTRINNQRKIQYTGSFYAFRNVNWVLIGNKTITAPLCFIDFTYLFYGGVSVHPFSFSNIIKLNSWNLFLTVPVPMQILP